MCKESEKKIGKVFDMSIPFFQGAVNLATYKHHEEECGKKLKKRYRDVTTCHFGAIRSSNRYEDCSTQLQLGELIAPPDARIEQAYSIFPEDVEKQNAWLNHKNHEEQYQTAHRLRLIRNPGRTVIIAAATWARYLLGEPDTILSLTKEGVAMERVYKYLAENGVLYKEDCYRLGIGDDERKIRRMYRGEDIVVLKNANWWTNIVNDVVANCEDVEIIGVHSSHGGAPRKALRYKSETYI